MSIRALLILFSLSVIELIAAYMHRVYSEYGKILSREVEENLDAWERDVEPRLGLSREQAAMCAEVLELLAIALIALELGAVLFDRGPVYTPPTLLEFIQALLALGLIVALCNQLLPSLLLIRTRGLWARSLIFPIRLLLWIVAPIALIAGVFLSLASIAQGPQDAEQEDSVDVDALLEAGEEEGILEESDRELVRSAVEFGDTLVREVMTPRPAIFAVPGTMTLEKFLDAWREQNYSRVPVYGKSLDDICGVAIAHDLLRITDVEARTRTVASIARPVEFVPETKRGYELLREMQKEKQHMRIVIDEYGAVAGVVTIEDLLEEIVGDIRDERDIDLPLEEPTRQADGSWILPGNYDVDQLAELFGEAIELGDAYEATTVGGLVSEVAGSIPHAGELVVLKDANLRIEVLASTDRRVDRVRVYPPSMETEPKQ
jgi:CBS domain containing-hemolysin-like protein